MSKRTKRILAMLTEKQVDNGEDIGEGQSIAQDVREEKKCKNNAPESNEREALEKLGINSTQTVKDNHSQESFFEQMDHERSGKEFQQKNGLEQIKDQQETIRQDIFVQKPLEDSDKELEDGEFFQSSGSEYIPDTTDCESDEAEYINLIPTLRCNEFNRDVMQNSSTALPSTSTNYSRPRNEAEDRLLQKSNVDGVIVSYGRFLQTSSNIEQFANIRPWTKKCSCPYCYQEVTHFPRHLKRNHQDKGAVKEFLSMSVKDPKRKELLNAIRRQGNFTLTSRSKLIRPVRRPKSYQNYSDYEDNLKNSKEQYVVCPDCLGYFKRNYLRRHRKHCALRSKPNQVGNREEHLSASQLFTVCSGAHNDFYSTLRLKNEVFPIMRNDDISKTAMNDTLICCYAESLLRKHKRTQIRNVISNKLRELGRFLLTLKKVTGLQQLFDILKPQFFDNCVSTTKVISGYEEKTRTFKASSLALHMGTTLKQICDIATKMIIKKSPLFCCPNPEEALIDIKRLKNLIENHWSSEISSLALKNLNEQRYEKPKLLPLTQDVMQFQKFVLKEAKKACKALRENRQIMIFYRRLSECILALTLLLNRKRIGEIQYLKSKTYYKTVPQNQQEEFLQVLSETERTLTKTFKRVVTPGKGSRPVAILFPKDIQEFIKVLFSVRSLCVPETNEYLFANPNTRNGWLNGYHTMKKLAEESGVNDTSLFTSTRLRKQIATILQVLNITEDEMEQFTKFMGHTRKTHESYYRLPQDMYQTAKVSKLLIAINSGKSSFYKGKTLDEINLSDIEVDVSDSEKSNGNDYDSLPECAGAEMSQDRLMSDENVCSYLEVQATCHNSNNNDENEGSETKKNKITRIRWTEEQKTLIKDHFKEHINKKKPPRKEEVERFINQHKYAFKEKNWIKVKAFVYNCYK